MPSDISDIIYDFIICGAGIAGSVLAGRLRQRLPTATILLLEAGPDPRDAPETDVNDGQFGAAKVLAWNYVTAPQKHLDGATRRAVSGKGLSGGALINGAAWTRGPAIDYDTWAEIVGDKQWKYKNMLPYIKRSETFRNLDASSSDHGHDGPMEINAFNGNDPLTRKRWPLFRPLVSAWESIGLKWNKDLNSGFGLGLGDVNMSMTEEFGREHPHQRFPLGGTHIITKVQVHCVLLQHERSRIIAKGVRSADGQQFQAKKEVILCAGAYQTPKILMLSGIGSMEELSTLGINAFIHNPEVGRNLRDHLLIGQVFRLQHPEEVLAVGSPNLDRSRYPMAPSDIFTIYQADQDKLRAALITDNLEGPEAQALLSQDACHLENFFSYVPIYARTQVPISPKLETNGSYISSWTILMTPTSRGSVTISSADPYAPPIIDPNYYATEVDREIMRSGVRQLLQVALGSDALKDIIAEDIAPDDHRPLHLASSDEEIDARIKANGETMYHPMGTASMGKVVDSECRVIGVKGLRIVDASVIPVAIAAHTQAPVYALAEKAAEIIVSSYIDKPKVLAI